MRTSVGHGKKTWLVVVVDEFFIYPRVSNGAISGNDKKDLRISLRKLICHLFRFDV